MNTRIATAPRAPDDNTTTQQANKPPVIREDHAQPDSPLRPKRAARTKQAATRQMNPMPATAKWAIPCQVGPPVDVDAYARAGVAVFLAAYRPR